MVFTVDAHSPAEVAEMVSRVGVHKGNMHPVKVFFSSVSAGCLLSFAAASSLTANTSPWLQTNAPGVARLLGAIVFPYGLMLIVLTGADLCTGTFMYTAMAVFHRRLSVLKMLLHWTICFWGNLAGALFIVAIIFGYGGVFDAEPYRAEVISYAVRKQVIPDWHMIFLRSIGCNWLVCLGCMFGLQGRDLTSKVVGMWWPIFAFVSVGFDHVVANMFFVPMGIWYHTPDLSVGLYIWKGIIPSGLGNIIGGALFVAAYYYGMYLFREPPVLIDGVSFEAHDTAEKGLRYDKRKGQPHSDQSSGASDFKRCEAGNMGDGSEIQGA